MGADIYFTATEKRGEKNFEAACFYFARAGGIAGCILSFFASFLPVAYRDGDTYGEYPRYHITPEAWERLLNAAAEQAALIDHLADYVETVYDFDPYVADELRDLSTLDRLQVLRFDKWFARTFHVQRITEEAPGVIALNEKQCERVITDAYALRTWLQMDTDVRPYLLDDRYTLCMGIC